MSTEGPDQERDNSNRINRGDSKNIKFDNPCK